MRSKRLGGVAALAVAACAILLGGQSASASMYYPWAEQFPFDQPGTVNPDVITGPLLATSTYWLALSDYGFYRPTFGPDKAHPCRHRECRDRDRW